MNAAYLRVKNWAEFQHYKDKEPGWIKLYAKSIRDDRFLELNELEQWQLVRIWIIASQSSRFVRDDDGRKVPVVVDDELSLRRAIATVKKIPLAKFVRDGWLIPIDAAELLDEDENAVGEASHSLDGVYTETRPRLGSSRAPARARARPGAQTRGNREAEVEKELAKGSGLSSYAAPRPLPDEEMLEKLLRLIGDSADDGTRGVLTAYARQLPPASLAKVIQTTTQQPAWKRARYANGALQSEIAERNAAT